MTTNLHDKMLAAIDAYFSACNRDEEMEAEDLLLDVQDAINEHKLAAESLTVGLRLDDWPKIVCVNHDCDKCKAQQPVACKTLCELCIKRGYDFCANAAKTTPIPAPPAQPAPDYAWPTIEDYEKEVGFKVNEAFRAAWTMARTTNDLFKQMGSDT